MANPKHVEIARRYIGVREVVGPKHSPIIMGWIKRLGAKVLGTNIADDEAPWCGTFIAEVMVEAGLKPAPIAVRAGSWATWGVPVMPQVGAVGVKARQGGNHVFLIVGITAEGTHYKALGGNQGNAVSIVDIAISDVHAIRWPAELPPANIRLPVIPHGTVSKSEA